MSKNSKSNSNKKLKKNSNKKLTKKKKLVAYKHDGFWQCMDTIREKKELNEIWNSKQKAWK